MAQTVTIQIGNTDNKLTQQEWSNFVMTIEKRLKTLGVTFHFSAGSATEAPWQNYCWVVEASELTVANIRNMLLVMTRWYDQDSIAMTVGQTELVSLKG